MFTWVQQSLSSLLSSSKTEALFLAGANGVGNADVTHVSVAMEVCLECVAAWQEVDSRDYLFQVLLALQKQWDVDIQDHRGGLQPL